MSDHGGRRHVVVGGNVAALVAADALAAKGRDVDLHLPERGVGGSFAPIERGGRRLDLGPRLIELSYDDAVATAPPLADYRPGPHGHRPYLQLIDELVRGLVGDDLVEVSSPQVSVAGRRGRDYVLRGDLSDLTGLVDPGDLAAMATEAEACCRTEGPHGVFAPGREAERWERSFRDVGVAHTGPRFHELLIEPLAARILEGGSSQVVAALHRKIWLPLFHPITAWQACVGELAYQPQRPMYSVDGGGMGAIVDRLVERLHAHPRVDVITSGVVTGLSPSGADELEIGFGDGRTVVATRPVLGIGAEELCAAAGVPYEPEKVVSSMAWVDVAEADVVDLPSVLFAAEPDLAVFRVSDNLADRVAGRRTLCCELDHAETDLARWPELIRASLVTLGVVRPAAHLDVVMSASRPSFATPSLANRARFAQARDGLRRLSLPMVATGGAADFGADSFNEQVVQGLAAAARA